jgi:hypothetical protein
MLVNHFGTKQASIAKPVGVRILFWRCSINKVEWSYSIIKIAFVSKNRYSSLLYFTLVFIEILLMYRMLKTQTMSTSFTIWIKKLFACF